MHAVENVSFDLYPGETLGLVGESGCGKSTTGRSLLKLVDSQSGTITFAGRRIDQLKGPALQHLRRDIQFIFQDPYASLDPRLTVGFSIMEPLLVHNVMRGREAEQRVAGCWSASACCRSMRAATRTNFPAASASASASRARWR